MSQPVLSAKYNFAQSTILPRTRRANNAPFALIPARFARRYCGLFAPGGTGRKSHGIVPAWFEGKSPLLPDTLATIRGLKDIYGCGLSTADSHNMKEKTP